MENHFWRSLNWRFLQKYFFKSEKQTTTHVIFYKFLASLPAKLLRHATLWTELFDGFWRRTYLWMVNNIRISILWKFGDTRVYQIFGHPELIKFSFTTHFSTISGFLIIFPSIAPGIMSPKVLIVVLTLFAPLLALQCHNFAHNIVNSTEISTDRIITCPNVTEQMYCVKVKGYQHSNSFLWKGCSNDLATLDKVYGGPRCNVSFPEIKWSFDLFNFHRVKQGIITKLMPAQWTFIVAITTNATFHRHWQFLYFWLFCPFSLFFGSKYASLSFFYMRQTRNNQCEHWVFLFYSLSLAYPCNFGFFILFSHFILLIWIIKMPRARIETESAFSATSTGLTRF